MKVNVYYIRHSMSGNNAIAEYARFYQQWRRLIYMDPPITKYGKDQAEELHSILNTIVPSVDHVFSSVLLRSIQTAMILYPDRYVNIIPYATEIYPSLGNYATSKEYQMQFLNDFFDDPKFRFDSFHNSANRNASDYNLLLKNIASYAQYHEKNLNNQNDRRNQ